MTGDGDKSMNEDGGPRERPDAIAEARTRMFCTAALLPLAVVFVTLFLPAMTFFHESGLPIFMLPLPVAFVWPVPVYLAAGALCVEIITARRGTRNRLSRFLSVLLVISIITNALISVAILVIVVKLGEAYVAAPIALFPGLGLIAFLRARRHQGMRRVSFILLSYSLSTGPYGAVLVSLMNDKPRLHWGGYITFVALILVFLISLVAVIPPGPPDDYKGKEL